jgi:hypothetical protein
LKNKKYRKNQYLDIDFVKTASENIEISEQQISIFFSGCLSYRFLEG